MAFLDTVPLNLHQAVDMIPLGAPLSLPEGDYPDRERLARSPSVGDRLRAIELYGLIWGDCVDE